MREYLRMAGCIICVRAVAGRPELASCLYLSWVYYVAAARLRCK
jgi:hypothetical protein